jgi:hypothetical protein
LTLGQPHRNTAIQAPLQSRRSLALLVVLVLCLSAFVLAANEAWAKEQPSSKEQLSPPGQPTGEKTTIGNGKPVADEPTPTPTAPPVSTTPPVETPPTETVTPSPSDPLPSKAKSEPAVQPPPQPTPVQRPVVIQTTGGESESVGPSDELVSPSWKSEPTRTESVPTTESVSTTMPSESGPVPASAASTTDLGAPETEVPAVAEQVPTAAPAAVPASISAAFEVSEPLTKSLISGPALQQVAQGVAALQGIASQVQARPVYSSGIVPTSSPVQPLTGPMTQALTNVVGTSASTTASAVVGLLGTVGQWVSDAASSSGEDSYSSSGGIMPEPFAPLSPEPLGSEFAGLFSGMGQASSGGAGAATTLLGVLFVTSTLLLRRNFRTYLVSIELPKPSSALLSPLERPG